MLFIAIFNYSTQNPLIILHHFTKLIFIFFSLYYFFVVLLDVIFTSSLSQVISAITTELSVIIARHVSRWAVKLRG